MLNLRNIFWLAAFVGFGFLMAWLPSTAQVSDTGDANAPTSDVDYWLQRAETVDANSADANAVDVNPEDEGTNPFRGTSGFVRSDALPGVVLLSNGRLIPGGVYGTREKPWRVYVAKEKRWRRIPPLAVLSITPKVIEERMELEWRWKAMGEPEKVYTGRKIPVRRFLWTFHLMDDTTVTGVVKGQPLWVETETGREGPFILHERSKGKPGTTHEDLVYVKKVIISRRMMQKTIEHLKTCDAHRGRPAADANSPTTQPSG
jgi:hypothetical protein